MILDGDSAAHLAPPSFGVGLPLVDSTVRLRNVQKVSIPLLGDRVTPMVLANSFAASTKFHVSETCSRPLWSVGVLYVDEKDGSYTKMEMERVKNCFGIPAKVSARRQAST